MCLSCQRLTVRPSLSGIQVKNMSFMPTCKDAVLWCASVTEMCRARPQIAWVRILNPVSGRQCHLIHLTILRRLA